MPATMMASSTLSMATLATSGAQLANKDSKCSSSSNKGPSSEKLSNSSCHRFSDDKLSSAAAVSAPSSAVVGSQSTANGVMNKADQAKPASTLQAPADSRGRRNVIEEVNDDSIYCIYLKKITYTFNNSLNKQANNSNYVTRCDQVDCSGRGEQPKSNSKWYDDQQSLQWETRQLRTIKGATIEHLVQYMLLLTPFQAVDSADNGTYFGDQVEEYSTVTGTESSSLLEERNNVAHAMHVIFATYRQFVTPWQLFSELLRQKPFASAKQFNFILYYWLNNYPEDFWTPCQPKPTAVPEVGITGDQQPPKSPTESNMTTSTSSTHTSEEPDSASLYSEYTSSSSSSQCYSQDYHLTTGSTSSMSGSGSSTEQQFSPLTLADQLISMRHIDEEVKKHCLHLLDMKKENTFSNKTLTYSNHKSVNKTSSILELDSKFIAQQLTAIDLENFLTLKPYTLLSNARSKTKIEAMIRNFNLLSRHVIITVLQHSTPHLVAIHWIEVASHLRKMRNFNSLKAIIAGLTNESIYRLKSTVWNKLSRTSTSTFTYLSSIVDDVNNQTLLRHTQLFIEGTSKVSLEESFGTVPYLGTFLTDITMINTRYPNHIKTDTGKKLINFEKCCKQYEILMQMQLLQKNGIAALQQQQQQNYHLGPIYSLNHYLSLRSQAVPSTPRVARIFRNWFQLNEADLPSDRECYQISLSIENSPSKGKK